MENENLANYKNAVCDKEHLIKKYQLCCNTKGEKKCYDLHLEVEACDVIHDYISQEMEIEFYNTQKQELWKNRLQRHQSFSIAYEDFYKSSPVTFLSTLLKLFN
ncbi:hypothetical protein SteCoe_25293 [Stentor coeruleus]|uniref:Uncharacterized protein n=1 Tax=Stentor coeruleus TaxID=5963 RepID=A0A1R2BFN9_9CILI|nr:hypothetical protein SteCoe_25293 [Stentor coeruleus]